MKQRGKIYGLMTALLACMIVMMMPGKVYAGDMELKEETVTADNILSSGGFLTGQDGLLLEKLKGTKIASNLMAAKEAIREGIIARQESISVYDYNITIDELLSIYPDVLNENPEFFYVTNRYGYSSAGTRAYAVYPQYDSAFTQTNVNALLEKSQQIVKGMNKSWTDEQKLLYLHEYLITHCQYDTVTGKNNAYYAIIEGKSQCHGYALAMNLLGRYAGLDVIVVTSNSQNHAWNMVLLDGKYYFIDCTWDDPVGTLPILYCRHVNFLRSRGGMQETGHTAGADWIGAGYGNVYNYAVDSTKYDNYFWKDVATALACKDGGYTYANAGDRFHIYDVKGSASVYAIPLPEELKWYVWGSSTQYYTSNYSYVAEYGGDSYFSTPTKIYKLNAANEFNVVYELSATEQARGYIYAMRAYEQGVEYFLGTNAFGVEYEAHTLELGEPEPEFAIVKQPVNWEGLMGQKACFQVEATGVDLKYQWQYQKGGVWYDYGIATADTAKFSVKMTEKNVKWAYRCIITDAHGATLISDEVMMIDVTPVPEPDFAIVKQPVDWVGLIGKKASFTVEATGKDLQYQWQYKKSGVWNDYLVTTGNTANFMVSMNEKNIKWALRCVITDAYGATLITDEVWMVDATIPTEPTIEITQQPVNWTGQLGQKATFTVAASGTGLTYQWQYLKDNKWCNYTVTSATTATLKITTNVKNVTYPVRCQITDDKKCTVYTNEVSIIIREASADPIKITKQPKDWTGVFGKKATFIVTATGNGLTYQWQYKKSNKWYNYTVTSATVATFKVTMNEKNVQWPVRCLITDADGNSAATNEVWLKLEESNEFAITSQPSDWYGVYGKKASFNVTATGVNLSYQWQYKKGSGDWTNYAIATADTANFLVSMNEKNVNWAYRCVITDGDGNVLTTNEVHMYLAQ